MNDDVRKLEAPRRPPASRHKKRLTYVLPVLMLLLAPACRDSAGGGAAPSSSSGDAHAATASVSSARGDSAAPQGSDEHSVFLLPLEEPLSKAAAEVSGLAWHGSDLLLLPQHPFRMANAPEQGRLFTLPRAQIEAFLSGRRDAPLRPRPLVLKAPELKERSPTYEGCEALAVRPDGRAYLAIEAVSDADTGVMRGYLFAGAIRGDTLRLNTRRRARLAPQTGAHNIAYEALVARPSGGGVAALYEANGRNVNARPRAKLFSPVLERRRALPFPPLEYRLTDATAPDDNGRFWVSNYFFPGERDKLNPPPLDSLPDRSASRSSSSASPRPVERLVEFHFADDRRRIERTSAPPLRLSLRPGTPRNWEGLVRLESDARGSGFLLVTDQYPDTLLGFVAAEQAR